MKDGVIQQMLSLTKCEKGLITLSFLCCEADEYIDPANELCE